MTTCSTHNRPMLREFHGKLFCLECRNEHKRAFYSANPYHVFGKGKTIARRDHHYDAKPGKRAEGAK